MCEWCYDEAGGKLKKYNWVPYANDLQEKIQNARGANDLTPISFDIDGDRYVIYPHGPATADAVRKRWGVGLRSPVQVKTESGWQRQIAWVKPTTDQVVDEEPPPVKEEFEEWPRPTKRRKVSPGCSAPAVNEDRQDDGGHVMWKKTTAWVWQQQWEWKRVTAWVESED